MTVAIHPSLVRLHAVGQSDRVQTYAEVAEIVSAVRAALTARSFRCPPNSALGSLFLKADKLQSHWESQSDAQDILTLMATLVDASSTNFFPPLSSSSSSVINSVGNNKQPDALLTSKQLLQGCDQGVDPFRLVFALKNQR